MKKLIAGIPFLLLIAFTLRADEESPEQPDLNAAPSPMRSAAFAQPAPAPKARYQYVGMKKCKMCHVAEYGSWLESAKGGSWNALQPGANAGAKKKAGLDEKRDYSGDERCLKCHTVGFGAASGYSVPNPNDPRSVQQATSREGVGCEACHGPGSGFVPIMQDILRNERRYRDAELMAAGLNITGSGTCIRCHTEQAPCIVAGYEFRTGTRAECGTHEVFPRKLRDP